MNRRKKPVGNSWIQRVKFINIFNFPAHFKWRYLFINKPHSLPFGMLMVILSILYFTSCRKDNEKSPPNIIIILADDMGYSDIGCFGSEIPTPNIDYLADHGMVMTQFYNASRCCPTRASLLTGLYPHQAGMGDMVEGRLKSDSTFLQAYQGWLPQTTPIISEWLKEAGYQTYISGKWHVGDEAEHWPDQRGFDRSFSLINGASNYFNLSPWIHKDQDIMLTLDGKNITTGKNFYMTRGIADHALEFIEKKDPRKPFFLYLPFTAPHWPLHALPEDIKLFEGKYLEGWETLREKRFDAMKAADILDEKACLTEPYFANGRLTPAWDTLSEESKKTWDRRMAVYAAQVYRMDVEIGRILNTLRNEGILDNTLIWFLSDNGATQAAIYLATGWHADRTGPIGSATSFDAYGAGWANVSNTPFKLFKHWTAEGGIATPLIVYWPEVINPGTDRTHYGHVIDILPTCLETAGISQDYLPAYGKRKELEGQSLFPLFEGREMDHERPLFWEHQGNWAVRKGSWKLLFTRELNGSAVNTLELFDLNSDRSECHDLSGDHPGKVAELKKMYIKWAEKVGVEPWDSLILARNL